MNKFLAPLFLIIVSCFASCREDDVAPEQEKCKNIIQKLSTYKTKSIDMSGHIEQNGTIIGYFDGDDIKLAAVSSFGQQGRKEERYFFHSNNLIAVQVEDYTYNKPQYITEEIAKTTGDSTWYDDSKTTMKTNWYYFYNNHMVKWIAPGNKIVPDNHRSFDKKDDELQLNADKLKQMLLSK